MEPNNQYDFITNSGSTTKANPLSVIANMSKKKLALIGGSGLLLIMILVTVLASVIGGGPTNKDDLLAVAGLQTELIRVSDIALKDAKNSDARNLATTTKLSLRSDQSALVAALKAQKIKIPKAAKNSKNDQMITEAIQNNRLDQTYMEFIQEQLAEYQKRLNTAYKSTTNKKLKEALSVQYKNASVLVGVDPEL